MEKEVDSFLDGLNEVPQDPFAPNVDDPFTTKKEEKKADTTEDDAEDTKPVPFHKDPKVQRYVEKEIAKALKDIKPSEVQQFKESAKEDSDLVSAFQAIIGNDTPEKQHALKMLKKTLETSKEEAATLAYGKFQADADARRKADKEAQEELDSGFDAIEEAYKVDISSNAPQSRKTRAEFVDFVKRISPKDDEGNIIKLPDLVEAFDVFKSTQKAPAPNRAKELAARSMTRSADASTAPTTTDKSWAAVDRLFSKLST